MKRRLTSWLLAASLLLPTFSAVGCATPNPSGSSSGGEETGREVFRFAMLSDIHLQTHETTSTYNFARAIAQCEERAEAAGGKLDAVAIAGDLLDNPWYNKLSYEDGTSYVQTDETRGNELTLLRNSFDTYLSDETALFYVLGNHDMIPSIEMTSGTASSRGKSPRFYREHLEKSERDYYAYDVKAEDTEGYDVDDYEKCHNQGCRYARIAGCNFIMLTNYTYWKTASQNYHVYQIEWLKATLDYISATYADEPIFLITHNPVFETVPGSVGTWGGPDLIDILDDYPQLVTFTGHVHESTYNQLAVYQDRGFTAVECGSVKYTAQGNSGDVVYTSESSASSQGLLVTVEKDTSIKIERLDFTAGKKSGQDWVIPAVGAANRHTKYSLENKRANNQAPYFESGTTLQAMHQNGYLNVLWSEAKDDDQVWNYKVTATYSDGSTKTATTDTAKSVPILPETYCVTFQNASEISSVSVVAVDCLGAESAPMRLMAGSFINWSETTLDAYLGASLLQNSLTMGGYTLNNSQQYNVENGVLSNLKTMYGRGNYLLNAYGSAYTYSYKVSSSRCSKAWVSAQGVDAPYRLGTCLASFVQNGRQYSICAQLEFNVKGANGTRTPTNKIHYYLQVTTPSGYTYAQQILMGSTDLVNADQIKAAFESESGATLKVQREGTSFALYIDNVLIDRKDFGGAHFYNHTFFVFNADTVASFGVSAYGGEANYSDFQVQVD